MAFDLGDYKEVSERLSELFAKHPEASLRGTYELIPGYVIYRAECYRTPDDPAPAVGTAWEQVPGKTTYTQGSELQNAETSAWGRAIVAAGASTSKRIASADDMRSVEARNATAGPSASQAGPASSKGKSVRRENIKARCVALQGDNVSIADARKHWQLPPVDKSDDRQLGLWEEMLDELEASLTAPFAEASA